MDADDADPDQMLDEPVDMPLIPPYGASPRVASALGHLSGLGGAETDTDLEMSLAQVFAMPDKSGPARGWLERAVTGDAAVGGLWAHPGSGARHTQPSPQVFLSPALLRRNISMGPICAPQPVAVPSASAAAAAAAAADGPQPVMRMHSMVSDCSQTLM